MKSKIALIGCGYWGSKILNYMYVSFDVKYIANSKFDLNQIWKDNEVESVIIATPIDTHYKLTKEALLNGKNVYVEKPISLHLNEAIELKEIAKEKQLKLAVEYTQMFSKCLLEFSKYDIGQIKYIEMSTKHLGRFMEFDVYWLLASHHLSVLDMFFDLNSFEYKFDDYMFNNNICTTGSITCKNKKVTVKINVSLDYYKKDFNINFYGTKAFARYNPLDDIPLMITWYDKTYKDLSEDLITDKKGLMYDEKNNLKNSMEYFKDLLDNKYLSNVDTAIKVTRILEKRSL